MTMRRLALLAMGVLASSPAFAADLYYHHPKDDSAFYAPTPMVVGDLAITGGFISASGTTSSSGTTAHEIGGAGRASVPLAGASKFEMELAGGYLSTGSKAVASYGAIGHLYADSPTHAIGAFAGTLGVLSAEIYTLGIEANAYLGATTLTGQFGILKRTSGNSGTIYAARGGADYYLTPNKKLMAHAIYYSTNGYTIWNTSAGFESRFAGTPWSIYGLVGYTSAQTGSAWSGTIGARVLFDDPNATLQQHDKAVPFNANLSLLELQ